MKAINLFVTILLLAGFTATSVAQTGEQSQAKTSSARTESFKVWGKCDMCKTRIESTVKNEGVTSAAWDKKTQLLTVTFDPSKTDRDALSKKLASAGHDTEKYKAPDDVYAKLPACCHYDRVK